MEPGIDEFWRWWETARDEIAAAFDAGTTDTPLTRELLERGAVLGLDIECCPGRTARHAVCASCNGDAALRKLAYHWWQAAPVTDDVFEYHPARLSDPTALEAELDLGGTSFPVGELRLSCELDEDRAEIDVVVWHPAFAVIEDGARVTVTFLALDWLLGEEDVERWIGRVEASVDEPDDALGPAGLLEAVDQLRTSQPDEHWALLQGDGPGGEQVVVAAARPLKPVDHPLLDTLVEVTTDYIGDEMPDEDELERLHAFEDELLDAAGGGGFFAAHITGQGERRFLIYCDSDGDVAERVRRFAGSDAEVDVSHDPGWDAVQPFR